MILNSFNRTLKALVPPCLFRVINAAIRAPSHLLSPCCSSICNFKEETVYVKQSCSTTQQQTIESDNSVDKQHSLCDLICLVPTFWSCHMIARMVVDDDESVDKQRSLCGLICLVPTFWSCHMIARMVVDDDGPKQVSSVFNTWHICVALVVVPSITSAIRVVFIMWLTKQCVWFTSNLAKEKCQRQRMEDTDLKIRNVWNRAEFWQRFTRNDCLWSICSRHLTCWSDKQQLTRFACWQVWQWKMVSLSFILFLFGWFCWAMLTHK